MLNDGKLFNSQIDGLFCDTADRKPVRTVVVEREGDTTTEEQVIRVAIVVLRTAPVVAAVATAVQPTTAEVPVSCRQL